MTHSPDPSGLDRRAVLSAGGAALLVSGLPPVARVAASPGPGVATGLVTGPAAGPAPVVATASGKVQGAAGDGVARFLGIPYAQPISGARRFAPLAAPSPWDGIFAADRHADLAPQGPEPVEGSPVTPAFAPPEGVEAGEDCLALNIWTPAAALGGAERLPVMVWLHGGGWQSGSGSCAIHDGTRLASRGDVVAVTLNHRLGAHGLTDFSRVLGGDWAQSANPSVKDMIAALEWVRDNIAAFGGDPDCVTIFGESGGGWKVNTLLASPAAEGLFHRAVVQSGPLTRFLAPDAADAVARRMLDALGIDPAAPGALHDVTMGQVLAAEAEVMKAFPLMGGVPGMPRGFWPVLEAGLLPTHAWDPEAAPPARTVPLMVGQTGTEMSLFMAADQAAWTLDEAGLAARVEGLVGPGDGAWILAAYGADFPAYGPSALWFRILSDFMMGALSAGILDAHAAAGGAPTWAYRFEWMTPIADGTLWSPHTIEIPFVFDNVATGAGRIMTGGGAGAEALAEQVSEAWVQFARTGRPAAPGLPDWPEYRADDAAAMHLDSASAVRPYMDGRAAGLFQRMIRDRAGLD
ncbi:carboxylesterase/lipase family protein [Rhodovulum sp. DZ06]|uniref:carboxylesterase/lipase family protein n=1 Tax=Rhodovulum sp. DZ06 TaxID=3425126 RepID=UPI003D3271E3